MFKLSGLYSAVIISKLSPDFECGYKKPLAKLIFSLMRLYPIRLLKWMRRFSRAVFSFLSGGKRLATVYGSHGFPRESYCAEWFDSSVELKFENGVYPAPIGYKDLLTNMYGDYMTPPSEDERHGHFEK